MAKMTADLSLFTSNPASYYVQNDSIQQKFEREFEAILCYHLMLILLAMNRRTVQCLNGLSLLGMFQI